MELETSKILPDESEKTPKKKKKKKKDKNDSGLNGSLTHEDSIEKHEDFSSDVPKKKKASHKKEDSLMEVDKKEDVSQEMTNLHSNGLAESTETGKLSKKKKKKRTNDIDQIINNLMPDFNDLKMEVDDSMIEVNDEGNPESNETEIQLSKSIKKKKKKNKDKNENINEESTNLENNLDKSNGTLEDVSKNFTILKAGKQAKSETVKRVLPDWLANPEVVSSNLNSGPSLDEIVEKGKLDLKIIENLKSQGFTKLFPVQERLLSWLLQCNENRKKGLWSRDTCVSAPTGSGNYLMIRK